MKIKFSESRVSKMYSDKEIECFVRKYISHANVTDFIPDELARDICHAIEADKKTEKQIYSIVADIHKQDPERKHNNPFATYNRF